MGVQTMRSHFSFRVVPVLAATMLVAACAQTGPVEFSAGGADSPSLSHPDALDFGPMDRSIAACKAAAKSAPPGQCAQVRAYESCMKGRGYITLLGPENPSGCGQPAWEEDVRKWLR
jgi:hypothetical protein